MNDFLQQFLIESREFVEQATEGLLVLERSPHDTELLDGVFRAFHTLKGGAGIVEFPAMERAVHAAENVLSAARSGQQTLTEARVGDCLHCLDQVVQWLDLIESSGELPARAQQAADAVIQRFEAAAGGPSATTDTTTRPWVAELLQHHVAIAAQATAAIRFEPDPDCFFQAEDPLARITSLPGLLALEVVPNGTSPPLQALDPYQCFITLTALSSGPMAQLASHMAGCVGEVDIVPIASAAPSADAALFSARARAVLEAQATLLTDVQPRTFVGRVTSAGLVAANVLRFCGRADLAEQLAHATRQAVADGAVQRLQEAIARVLNGPGASAAAPPQPARRTEAGNRTLRVDAARIDALVRLTSELTVAKNAMGHLAKTARAQGNALAGELKDRHALLEHLVSELQTQVLGMRVLPLRSVLQRFPRLVREMCANLGKSLRLEIEGGETEADKSIVEMLFEPLLHIVRNAIDHGIEPAPQRAQRGKPATALLHILAVRQGDQVLIEVRDDGGGVDAERVRQVAQERGVVSEERLGTMTEAEVIELIFAPGFSTAATLTELSGRGVGMDAVRTAVERVGGRVDIESRSGVGTTIRILLPFSVMMTRVMTVEAAAQVFGIPLDAIVETIRVPTAAIAAVGAGRALVVRERTVPILELADVLGVVHTPAGTNEVTIVIATAAGQLTGIQVDRLGEQLDVMLQPLDGLLAGTPGIAGTTLLGDGRVLLVLDIGALLQ